MKQIGPKRWPHTNPKAHTLSLFAFPHTCSSCSDLLAIEARFFCHMPGSNLTGRFETRMWYITEKVEPSRTKDIGGKFAVKKKNRTCRRVGPGERVVIHIARSQACVLFQKPFLFWKRQIGIGVVPL